MCKQNNTFYSVYPESLEDWLPEKNLPLDVADVQIETLSPEWTRPDSPRSVQEEDIEKLVKAKEMELMYLKVQAEIDALQKNISDVKMSQGSAALALSQVSIPFFMVK
jgi:hypothetical protein